MLLSGGRDFNNVFRMLAIEKLVSDNNPKKSQIRTILADCGISLENETCFLVKVEIIDTIKKVGWASGETINFKSMVKEIHSTIASNLAVDFDAYPMLPNDEIMFLVFLRQPADNNPKAIAAVLEQARLSCEKSLEDLREQLGLDMRACISRMVYKLEDIKNELLFFEKVEISELSSIEKAQIVYMRHNIDTFFLSPVGKTIEKLSSLERAFFAAGAERDFDRAFEAICQIIDYEAEMFPVRMFLPRRVIERISCFFGVAGIPLYTLEHPNMRVDAWGKAVEDAICTEDMKNAIQELFSECDEYFMAPSTMSARVEEIARFIEVHYADTELSGKKICDTFYVSPSYLSRIFKEKRGVKLIDFIHTCRVEVSKVLLSNEPDLTIDQVAVSVGYLSTLTFTRAFKRIEGQTPGAYRKTRGK
ncbi:MAG: helix-turn-helix transcriptional regulator [Saccharofermentanales bacterium]|jgi:AraC-like DNA-binding protein